MYLTRAKKIITLALFGFLAFAPPGTLIFIGLFVLGIFGKEWLIAGLVMGLSAAVIYAIIRRDTLVNSNLFKAIAGLFSRGGQRPK